MDSPLNPVEARVLGALIEKEITTEDYYPLSLNALVNACNQKSSRDPVMRLSEAEVREAVAQLEEAGLAGRVNDSRVLKFEHRARETLDLQRPEIAVLCLLLLRGPQTAGELRSRAERLYSFDDVARVQATLERMARPATEPTGRADPRPALVARLARRPGEKEARWAHRLSGEPEAQTAANVDATGSEPAAARMERLESELTALRERMERLERLLEACGKAQS